MGNFDEVEKIYLELKLMKNVFKQATIKNRLVIYVFFICLSSCNPKSPCDKFLEGYAKYVDKTIEILNKKEKNPSDTQTISDYIKLQGEAVKWLQIPDDCANDPDFLAKFNQIQLKFINLKK